MTVSELYDHVSRLGFEDSLEDAKAFYNTANRAIMQIAAIRPQTSSVSIHHRPPVNLLGDTFEPVTVVGEATYTAYGAKAYYFEADGKGTYNVEYLSDGEWISVGSGNLNGTSGFFTPERGVIKPDGVFVVGDVKLTFRSDYGLSVRAVALYDEVRGASAEDVPAFSTFYTYDVAEIVDDFLSFSSNPVREEKGYGRLMGGYNLEDQSRLILPHDASGVYRVVYNRRPRVLEETTSPSTDTTTVIDLDEELASLLPLLTAAYLWLEDEEEKAQYYMALYRERSVLVEQKTKSIKTSSVRNVYGW